MKNPKMNSQKKNVIKAVTFFGIAVSMMGNQSCQQDDAVPVVRTPKRRVVIEKLEAPKIGQFDFGAAARAQLPAIVMKSNGFTTSGVDLSKQYDGNLGAADEEDFRQCQTEEEKNPNNGLSMKAVTTTISACMMYLPHGRIYTNIYDFSLISQNGGSLGLAQIPGLAAANASFNFTAQKSELSLAMTAKSLLINGGTADDTDKKADIAAINQSSFATNWGGGLSIGFSFLQIGGNTYHQSNLARVVESGLSKAFENLRTQWDEKEPWYGMVVNNCDKYIKINAGSESNVKVGDILKIQNVEYTWENKACDSQLLRYVNSGVSSEAPAAYAVVSVVGDGVAKAVIISNDPNYPQSGERINPGARAYLYKLAEAASDTSK